MADFIASLDAKRLKPSRLIGSAQVLQVLKACLETTEIEQRLADIERAIISRETYKPRLAS